MSIRVWDCLLYAAAGVGCALLADVGYSLFGSKRRGLRFWMDLLFSLVCCGALFCVTVGVMQDNLRGYWLIAWGGAALLWEKTGGRLLRHVLCALRALLCHALRRTIAGIRRWFAKLYRGCRANSSKVFCKINKKSKSEAKRPFLFPKNRVK